jgi:hypothetical protein
VSTFPGNAPGPRVQPEAGRDEIRYNGPTMEVDMTADVRLQTYDPDGCTVEFAQGRRGHNKPA